MNLLSLLQKNSPYGIILKKKVGEKMNFKSALKHLVILICILITALAVCGCSVTYDLNDPYEDSTVSEDAVVSQDISTNPDDLIDDNPVVSDVISETTQSDHTFRNEKLLNDHFAKHNEDFDYETVEEYVQGANRVISNPDSLHKTEAEDGDDVYYLEETNEFVVVSTDGYIRTYFKPTRGIDYYNSQ